MGGGRKWGILALQIERERESPGDIRVFKTGIFVCYHNQSKNEGGGGNKKTRDIGATYAGGRGGGGGEREKLGILQYMISKSIN